MSPSLLTELALVSNEFPTVALEAAKLPALVQSLERLESPALAEEDVTPTVGVSVGDIMPELAQEEQEAEEVPGATPFTYDDSNINIEEEVPIPILIVEKTEENQPSFGETITEDSTEGEVRAFEKRQADAEPDQVIMVSEPEMTMDTEDALEEEVVEVPILVVEKTFENQPSHGDDPGPEGTTTQQEAFDMRRADAEPDEIVQLEKDPEVTNEVSEEPVLNPANSLDEDDELVIISHEDAIPEAHEDSQFNQFSDGVSDEDAIEREVAQSESETAEQPTPIPEISEPIAEAADATTETTELDAPEEAETQVEEFPKSATPLPEIIETSTEVADSAADLDAEEEEESLVGTSALASTGVIAGRVAIHSDDEEVQDKEETHTDVPKSATPLPEIVESSAEVADTAATLGAPSDDEDIQAGDIPKSATPLPEIVQTSSEVADTAATLDAPSDDEDIQAADIPKSATPLPEIVQTSSEVADTAATLDEEEGQDEEDIQAEDVPKSSTPMPEILATSSEVADTAATLDVFSEEEQDRGIEIEEASKSSTPLPEIAETVAEVADTAEALDVPSDAEEAVVQKETEAAGDEVPKSATPLPEILATSTEVADTAEILDAPSDTEEVIVEKDTEIAADIAETSDNPSDDEESHLPEILAGTGVLAGAGVAAGAAAYLHSSEDDKESTEKSLDAPKKETLESAKNDQKEKIIEAPILEAAPPAKEFAPSHSKVGSLDVGYGGLPSIEALMAQPQEAKETPVPGMKDQQEHAPKLLAPKLVIPGGFDTAEPSPIEVMHVSNDELLGHEDRVEVDRALKDQITENPALHQKSFSPVEAIPEPEPSHAKGKGPDAESIKITENIFEAQNELLGHNLGDAPSDFTTSLISIDGIKEALQYMYPSENKMDAPAIVISEEDNVEDNGEGGSKPRTVVEVITPTPEGNCISSQSEREKRSKQDTNEIVLLGPESELRQRRGGQLEASRPSTRGSDKLSTKQHKNLVQNFWHMVLVGWLGGFGRFFVSLFGRKK